MEPIVLTKSSSLKGKGKPVAMEPSAIVKGKGKRTTMEPSALVRGFKPTESSKMELVVPAIDSTVQHPVPDKTSSRKRKGKAVEAELISHAVVPSPGRADLPTVLPCKRANQETVLEAGASDEGRSRMLAAFDRDVTAASSRATGCALWNTWCTFHSVWFREDVPAIPLDEVKIRNVSACFKEGAYK